MTNGIVIPCYNESSRLDIKSYLDYAAKNKDTALCFVNDGSSDETRATLADIKNLEYDNVHIFNLSENSGKAKAVQQGALYLYNETEVDTIGFIDADLSTDFNDYHGLVKTMDANSKLKVIYGSRANDGENNIKRDFVRGIISAVIRYIILSITRLNIRDTQCGAKVFHRSLVPYIFNKSFKTRWLFDVEILLRLKREFKVQPFKKIFLEQPLKNWVHMDGSKLGMKDALSIPLSLLNIGLVYNLIIPFSEAVIRPIELRISNIKRSTVTKFSLATLAVLNLLHLALGNTISDATFNWIQITFSVTILMILGVAYVKFYMARNKRWKWFLAHANTYMRRFTKRD